MMSLTHRAPTAAKQVLPPEGGELMVLFQGGVNLFQGGALPLTGWLDKPLVLIKAAGVCVPCRKDQDGYHEAGGSCSYQVHDQRSIRSRREEETSSRERSTGFIQKTQH